MKGEALLAGPEHHRLTLAVQRVPVERVQVERMEVQRVPAHHHG